MRSLSVAFALGAYGGAVLALSDVFFTPGKYILFPYALVVLGLTIAIRAERLSVFAERFLVALIAFVTASLVLYVTVVLRTSATETTVLWRALPITFLLIVGVGISVPAAVLAGVPRDPRTYEASCALKSGRERPGCP
jgi:hypothetical protein